MLIQRIEGCTRVLGKAQGYRGLPICDALTVEGDSYMLSCWEPTPEELAALNAGGRVYLSVLGREHPPVMLTVKYP